MDSSTDDMNIRCSWLDFPLVSENLKEQFNREDLFSPPDFV